MTCALGGRWKVLSDGGSVAALKNLYQSRLVSYKDTSADSLALKLRDIKTEVIREKDGSYAVVCSALHVFGGQDAERR